MTQPSPPTCPVCGSTRFRSLGEQFSYVEQALDSVTYTLKCEDCGKEWVRTVERKGRTQANANEKTDDGR
jgi:transposase-like protein